MSKKYIYKTFKYNGHSFDVVFDVPKKELMIARCDLMEIFNVPKTKLPGRDVETYFDKANKYFTPGLNWNAREYTKPDSEDTRVFYNIDAVIAFCHELNDFSFLCFILRKVYPIFLR